jgi:hypothetical protein
MAVRQPPRPKVHSVDAATQQCVSYRAQPRTHQCTTAVHAAGLQDQIIGGMVRA